MATTEDLLKQLVRSQKQQVKSTQNLARQTSAQLGATRFTTPSIGGFRAFFSPRIIEQFNKEFVNKGIKNILRSRVVEPFSYETQREQIYLRTRPARDREFKKIEKARARVDPIIEREIAQKRREELQTYTGKEIIESGMGNEFFRKLIQSTEGWESKQYIRTGTSQFTSREKLEQQGKLSPEYIAAEQDLMAMALEMKKLADANANEDKRSVKLQYKQRAAISAGIEVLSKFGAGVAAITVAALKLRDALISTSQQLGGVSLGQAFQARLEAIGASITSIFSGRGFAGQREILEARGAVAQEFGGLISTERARELAQFARSAGLTTTELVQLQRTLQGTITSTDEAVSNARRLGIPTRVFAQELSKNADAVARAGSNFNTFIAEGIKNAKRLGLEFAKIEQTLTGFATDFSGTVQSFANLKSVLPTFQVDFQQLLQTSLTGSTDDLINLVRQGLVGGGITGVEQLSRAQVALLQQATGFGGAEIQRILEGSNDLEKDMVSLDDTRNSLLKTLIILLGAVGGAIVGAVYGGSFGIIGAIVGMLATTPLAITATLGALKGVTAGTLMGAGTGTVLGGVAGLGATAVMNDFVMRPGQPAVPFSPDDTLIGVKDTQDLTSPTVQQAFADTKALEQKIDQLNIYMKEELDMFRRGLSVEIKDFDKAILRRSESQIRNV